jgi:hypothetical protein
MKTPYVADWMGYAIDKETAYFLKATLVRSTIYILRDINITLAMELMKRV